MRRCLSVLRVGLGRQSVGLGRGRARGHGRMMPGCLLDRGLGRGRPSELCRVGLLGDRGRRSGLCQAEAGLVNPVAFRVSASLAVVLDLLEGLLVLVVALENAGLGWAFDRKVVRLTRASMAHEDARRSLFAEWPD